MASLEDIRKNDNVIITFLSQDEMNYVIDTVTEFYHKDIALND